jgi:hypothetical protein
MGAWWFSLFCALRGRESTRHRQQTETGGTDASGGLLSLSVDHQIFTFDSKGLSVLSMALLLHSRLFPSVYALAPVSTYLCGSPRSPFLLSLPQCSLLIDFTLQIVLDINSLSNQAYLSVGVVEVSPDGELVAYSVDETGEER